MSFIAIVVGIFALYSLTVRYVSAPVTPFGVETLKAAGPVQVLTRKVHRWNQLTRVREQYPYVGFREAYLENRSAVYYLFGMIPVFYRFFRIEIDMNDVIAVMTLGDRLNGKEMDKHFPDYLAYGGSLGKGGRMQGLPAASAVF